MWVLVRSTGKVFGSYIRDLSSIAIYTKNWLVSWYDDKELSSGVNVISWNSLSLKKKKKKKVLDELNKSN